MSETNEPTLEPEKSSQDDPVVPEPQVAAEPRRRLRDRLWSTRALIAVGLASVIFGGMGGALIAQAADGHGDDGLRIRGPGRMWQHDGRMHGFPGGPPGMQQYGVPPNVTPPGQPAPATPTPSS